jgi:hypothetical protein
MLLNELIKVLTEKNWVLKSSNPKFQFYVPPKDLGFDESYVLPIPSNEKVSDFDKAIKIASNVIGEIYQTDISQLITDVENYLDVLKKDAIYFKLTSEEAMFGNTLEINHIWSFLKNLSASYQNYIQVNFYKHFSFVYSADKLNKIIEPLTKFSRLRLVDLEYKSFSIGVSADSMMGNETIHYKDVSQWRQKKVHLYKNEILDVNYNDREAIDKIVKKYDDNERRKIFDPLIKSINAREHRIYLTDPTFKPKKELLKLPESTVQTILPKVKEVMDEPNIEMIEIVTTIDKSKKYLTIKTDELGKDLFSHTINETSWKLDEISVDDKPVKFTVPIEYKISLDAGEGVIKASHEILPLNVKSTDLKQIKSLTESQIVSFYKRYLQVKDTEGEKSDDLNKLIAFFNKIC